MLVFADVLRLQVISLQAQVIVSNYQQSFSMKIYSVGNKHVHYLVSRGMQLACPVLLLIKT